MPSINYTCEMNNRSIVVERFSYAMTTGSVRDLK